MSLEAQRLDLNDLGAIWLVQISPVESSVESSGKSSVESSVESVRIQAIV